MKSFSERSPLIIGALGVGLSATATLLAVSPPQLPFLSSKHDATAYFAEAGGLLVGAPVQVCGMEVGNVTDIKLDGARVRVDFNVDSDIRLGEQTEAAIKTKSVLGAKTLAVTPRGDGNLSGTIPLERTTSPYQLPEVLGELSRTISGLDTDQVSKSLSTLADTFSQTPQGVRDAVDGAARLAETINRRDTHLRNLLGNANKVSGVLADHSQQIADLVANTDAVLAELRTQSDALDQLSGNISSLSKQLVGLVSDNLAQMKPALDKLNGVLTILDNRKQRIQESLKLLNQFAMSLGESASSGPFFKVYFANLLPGQFMQPFIDAAFSDLGLDPNVKLPSELSDPQTGQPGTPALPMPFPRTGQGGEPRLSVPDAITGNSGDPRYPHQVPLPAPPSGGPPPGPPALAPPEVASTPTPSPSPVYVPAPNEIPPPSSLEPDRQDGSR
jgi:phospholipid/cholesterol/gamma-HCH transport system substrate-binding protein